MRPCITRPDCSRCSPFVPDRPASGLAGAQGIAIKRLCGLIGGMSFAALESFDAVLGTSSGTIFGGGAKVGLPWGGLFARVGAWRFSDEGERVSSPAARCSGSGSPSRSDDADRGDGRLALRGHLVRAS